MIDPIWMVWGCGVPAAISAAVWWLSGVVCGGRGWVSDAVGGAVGLAVGFAAGFVATGGWPGFWPIESHHWLFWVLLPLGVLVGVLGVWPRVAGWGAWLARLLLAVGAGPLLLQSMLRHTWSAGQAVVWLGGLGAAGIGVWWLWWGMSRRGPGVPGRPGGPGVGGVVVWMLVAVGTGLVVMFSGSQVLGQLGLVLGACLAGVVVAMLLRGWWGAGGGGCGVSGGSGGSGGGCLDVVMVVLIGLWINGCFYAAVSPWQVGVLAVSPMAAVVGEVGPVRRLPAWMVVLVRVAAVAVVVGTVVVVAGVRFACEMDQTGYY